MARAEGGFLRLAAGFAVRLKADEDVDAVRVRVRVSCPVVEDGQTGDPVPVDAACSVEAVDDPDRPGWRTLTLNQGETVRFDCVSDEYDPLWTVRFHPEVEAVGATS